MRLIAAPAHLGIIERPRLARALSEAPRLIVLLGPAGYGKTTLARQLTSAAGDVPVAWHGCQPGSADVAAIALGLCDAFERLSKVQLSEVRARVRTSPNPQREAEVLAEILSEHLGECGRGLWLCLDDYEHVARERAADEFVGALLAESALKTIVTSRIRPRWATARRVLYGEIREVTARELTMTEEEAKAVFAALGREASESELSMAAGWPAVVGLLARNPAVRATAGSGLNDFLVEEVCRGVEADVRDVIELLAAMPALSRGALGKLIGTRRSQRVVDEGLRRGILTENAEGDLGVHEVVRSFFESRAGENETSPHLRALVRTASEHLVEARAWDHAFALASSFSDEAPTDRLVKRGLRTALDEGRTVAVRRWLDLVRLHGLEIPESAAAEADLALREGAYLKAEAIASGVARSCDDVELQLWSYLLAGKAAHLGGREALALSYYRAGRELADTEDSARVAAWGELAVATDLELSEAPGLLAELQRSQLTTPDDQVRLACRALILGNRFGSLSALDQAALAIQLVDLVDDPYLRTSFLNAFSYISAIAGDYVQARAAIVELEANVRRLRLSFVEPYSALARSVVDLGERDLASCLGNLNHARDDARRSCDRFVLASEAAIRARALIAEGRFDEAASVASHDAGGVIISMRAELLATKALALACCEADAGACRAADEAGVLSRAVEVPVLCGAARTIITSRKSESEAYTLASQVADLARETRYVDGIVAAYRGYPEFGRLIARAPDHRRWLRDLMETSNDAEIMRVVGLGALGGSGSSLSPREAEVLQLMRHGLSNREIGQKLFISEATVKVHAQHIYDKLGVRTRTEAALKTSAVS